ncbi:MAG TPA: SAM-dependent chlorinase/fluorinase [Syntrophorhabdaceae bacterium]|nr:SAM-dependent chlorinase/fluorinase [Syntrophorhabdaceae bacterium]
MKVKTITLLTDFGLKDPYVGIMKGVILSINQDVRIVDITHEIEPQDIREGAFLLKEYYQYFPKGSIHVAIVDPTVGSKRRALALYKDGDIFIGPDNGIFSLLIESDTESYAVTNRDFMLKQISSSFHGRDVFAPIAAHFAFGLHPSVLGERVIDLVCLTNIYPDIINAVLIGEVVRFDKFGNAITNIDIETFNDFTSGNKFKISVGNIAFGSLHKSYFEQDYTCITGSSGYLEFGYYKGNFQEKAGIKKGEAVAVRTAE